MLYPGKIDPLSNATEENKRPMLLEVVRNRLRLKHDSLKTEKAYVYWIRRYILANNKTHPRELNGAVCKLAR